MTQQQRDPARDRQIQERYAQHQEHLRRLLVEGQGQSWDLAMDVVQDLFLRWLEMPADSPNQPDQEKELVWLKRCAWLRGLTQHDRQRIRLVREEHYAATQPAVDRRTPLDDLAERELPEVIRRVLEQSTDQDRLVYEMLRAGQESREIADTLDVSVETARRYRRRVLNVLREQLAALGWSAS